jgi:hypothetical protein
MRTLLLLAALLSAAVSCARKPAVSAVDTQFAAIDATYSTNDIRGAERELKAYIGKLSDEESNHLTGIDFDMARATVHERLFLIYRKEGRMDEMKREYEKSFDSLARYARRAGLPPPVTNSYEEFAAKIEMSERGLDVRWKKK